MPPARSSSLPYRLHVETQLIAMDACYRRFHLAKWSEFYEVYVCGCCKWCRSINMNSPDAHKASPCLQRDPMLFIEQSVGLIVMTLPARTGPKHCAPPLLRFCSFTWVPSCFLSLHWCFCSGGTRDCCHQLVGKCKSRDEYIGRRYKQTYVTVVGSLEYQRMWMDIVEGVRSNGYAMPCVVELITPPAKAAKGKSCEGISHSKWRSLGMTLIQAMESGCVFCNF